MDVSSSSPLELHLYHQIYGFPVPQYLQFQVSSVLSPQREGYHSIANGTLCRWEFTIRLCYHQKHLPLLLRLCLKIRWLLTCDRLRLSQVSTSGSHRILRKRLCYHQQFLPLLLRLCLKIRWLLTCDRLRPPKPAQGAVTGFCGRDFTFCGRDFALINNFSPFCSESTSLISAHYI